MILQQNASKLDRPQSCLFAAETPGTELVKIISNKLVQTSVRADKRLPIRTKSKNKSNAFSKYSRSTFTPMLMTGPALFFSFANDLVRPLRAARSFKRAESGDYSMPSNRRKMFLS